MNRSEATNARSRRTRNALLAAARELVEEHGADAVTMAAVADKATVSRRAVYLHFASRGALINALFGYVNEVEHLDDGIAEVLASADAEAALRRYADFLARLVPRILAVSNAIHHASSSDPDAAVHWATAMDFRRRTAHELISRLVAEDKLASGWTARTAEDMLMALVSNDVISTLRDDCGWSAKATSERLAGLFSSVLVARS